MSSLRIWLLALALVALAIAGCGGGGGDDSSESTASTVAAPKALSKAELIEQGDAICAEVNAAVGSIGSGSAEATGPAVQAADLYSGMIASLNNLGTPEESEGYAEFSSAAEELAKTEDEVKAASEGEDSTTLATAESNAAVALESFQEAAGEYGFEDCSEGPTAPVASGTEAGAEEESGIEEGGVEAAPETEVAPEEVEPAPEPAPETGGGAGVEGGGTGGGTEGGGGGTGEGSSGGIGPG
jgi:hypothetical protein